MGTRPRPIPDDFAVIAAERAPDALARHYRCSATVIVRWVRAMPLDWQSRRAGVMQRLHRQGLARGRAKANSVRTATVAPFPADMAARYVAADLLKPLAAGLGMSIDRLHYWAKRNPEAPVARSERIAAERPVAAAATRRAKAVGKPRGGRQSKPSAAVFLGYTPGAGEGLAARAAEHLKRATAFRPVCDGKVYGKAFAGLYVVGRLRLTVDDMVALSRKHGFDEHAWRRVA